MTARSHRPVVGDCYRLPSWRFVKVLTVGARHGEPEALCEDIKTGEQLRLTCRFLVLHGWRMV